MNPQKDIAPRDLAAGEGEPRVGEGRARILQMALEEFATRGFEGASTTSIARRSGVTQPLIHYHFGTKEGLWRATVNDLFTRLGTEFAGIVRRHPPVHGQFRTTFLELMREFVRFCGRNPQFPRLLYLELPVPSSRSSWLLETWVKPITRQVVQFHPAFARDAALKDLPLAHLMAIVTGAAGTFFALGNFMQDVWGTAIDDPANIELHAQTLVSLLENGLFVDRRLAPR